MVEGSVGRPRELTGPDTSSKIMELNCVWSAPILSYEADRELARSRKKLLMKTMVIMAITCSIIIIISIFKLDTTTLIISFVTLFLFSFFLIVFIFMIRVHSSKMDRNAEQSTMVYLKEKSTAKKMEIFMEMMDDISERYFVEKNDNDRGIPVAPEYIYHLQNGNFISIVYEQVETDRNNYGVITIGYHYDDYEHAKELQKKVDEFLFEKKAAYLK